MEGLDLLKQEWKKQDASLPKYKSNDLYKMLLEKSSSIVKWIFYISIIEFVFWIGLSIIIAIFDKDNMMTKPEFQVFNWISNIIFYGVIIFFMVKFYINYKRINTDDSIKGLMRNIIQTRRTVKHYVWFNLIFFALSFCAVSVLMYTHNDFGSTPEGVSPYVLLFVLIATLIVILGILILFYRLVYGILTRRLKKNYKELKTMEI